MPLQTRSLRTPNCQRQPHIPTIAQLVPIPPIAHKYLRRRLRSVYLELKRILRFPGVRPGRSELGLFGPWTGESGRSIELGVVGPVAGFLAEDVVVGTVLFEHSGCFEVGSCGTR